MLYYNKYDFIMANDSADRILRINNKAYTCVYNIVHIDRCITGRDVQWPKNNCTGCATCEIRTLIIHNKPRPRVSTFARVYAIILISIVFCHPDRIVRDFAVFGDKSQYDPTGGEIGLHNSVN